MASTVLQSEILTKFAYPFLLVFFIVFAILQKAKILGDNKQINALVAFVIGLIFVSAVYPKVVVSNMILFLVIALVIVFVVMMLWGFVMGDKAFELFTGAKPPLKWAMVIVVLISVVFAVFWAAGIDTGFLGKLFTSSWSKTFWTNFLFIALIAVALAAVLVSGKGGGSSSG